MTDTVADYSANVCFAAVKLIEQLYKNGSVSGIVFGNILKEYSNLIDTAKFVEAETDQIFIIESSGVDV